MTNPYVVNPCGDIVEVLVPGPDGPPGPPGPIGPPGKTETDPIATVKQLYVAKGSRASDNNEGTDEFFPLATLRAASLKAVPGTVVNIGPGTFLEVFPLRWKRDVQLRGSGIRVTNIGPVPTCEFTDQHKVDSGFKANEITFFGHQADATRQAWAISFDELADNSAIGAVGLGAYVFKSPYIQNCTSYTAEDDAGVAGSQSTGDTGGGILVDGNSCALNSPIRSMVVDSFTQVNLAGPGCLVRNDGYAQLVSFFGIFCTYHVRAESGGQWNLSGGGTTDFGISALQADGYSPKALYTATSKNAAYGAVRLESNVTFDIANNLILISDPTLIAVGDQVKFRADSGTLPGLNPLISYTVISTGFTGGAFRVSATGLGGDAAVLSGGTPGGFSVLRNGDTTIDIINVSANRLGPQVKYPTAGSTGSLLNPVPILTTGAGATFTVQLDPIPGIKHEFVSCGYVRRGNFDYPVVSCVYNNTTGIATISAQGMTPMVGDNVTLTGLSFICDSASRPGPGFVMFPRLAYPSAGPTSFNYARINSRTLTYSAPAAPGGPTHDYAEGGSVIIGGVDRLIQDCIYDKVTGLVTVTTKTDLPADATGSVTIGGLQFICTESRYIVQSAIPINAAGDSVDNLSPNKIGYRVQFFSDTNLGLRYPLAVGQVLDFRRRSQGSAPSHTMEYVGAGTNYSALPDYGGIPIPGDRIVETNGGRIFYTSVDELGNYVIGGVFGVDATTGVVTTTARGFIITNILGIGPFSRNGGFSSVGVQLREVSSNQNLIASTGAPDANTAPTQSAVVNYVGARYVSNVAVDPDNALRVTGLPVQDGSGNWSYVRTLSIAGAFSNSGLSMSTLRVLARTDAGSGPAQELAITAEQAAYWADPTATNLRAVIAGTTGTGNAVFSASPTLVTPALGIPASVDLSNAVNLPVLTGISGLAAGAASFLIDPTSTNLFNLLTTKTGTGNAVFSASPTLTGIPLSTTAAVDTNTAQLATTAFVIGQGYLKSTTAASTYLTQVNAAAGYQPLDGDLSAIAALGTTSFGRSFLDRANASSARTLLGLGSLATQSGTFSGASSGTNTGDQTIALTGEAAGSGSGSLAVTLSNSAIIGKLLTSFTAAVGAVTSADSILQAMQKLWGNANTSSVLALVSDATTIDAGAGSGRKYRLTTTTTSEITVTISNLPTGSGEWEAELLLTTTAAPTSITWAGAAVTFMTGRALTDWPLTTGRMTRIELSKQVDGRVTARVNPSEVIA